MADETKAVAIPKRHTKTCQVCLLIDSQADKGIIFHLYDSSYWAEDNKYICSKCLEQVKSLRKLCHLKFEQPDRDQFANFLPWFAKEMPAVSDRFKEFKI